MTGDDRHEESSVTLRWSVDDDQLTVDVVHRREGAFDDFEPVDVGPTNAVAVEDDFGAE